MFLLAAPVDFKHIANSVKALYTADNPYHVWVIIASVCVFACLSKSTRRFGAIGLVVAAIAFVLSQFLTDAFKAYT